MSARFLARRLTQGVVVMWIVATAVFFVFRVLPGDQASMILGLEASPEAKAALSAEMGLDRPVVAQYGSWLGNLATGDLGTSRVHGGASVSSLVFPAVLRSLELAMLATLFAVAIAVPLGMYAANRAGTWVDGAIRVGTTLGFSMPTYVLSILFLLLFAEKFRWLPPGGYVSIAEDPVRHLKLLILPVLTVGIVMSAGLTRFMRASMIEQLDTDYARTALGKGLSQRQVNYRHSLRNALVPLLTETGVNFGLLVGGMVIVEQIFAWPGLGWLIIQSVFGRAFEVVQVAVLISAGVLVLVNLAIDIIYVRIDPRIALRD